LSCIQWLLSFATAAINNYDLLKDAARWVSLFVPYWYSSYTVSDHCSGVISELKTGPRTCTYFPLYAGFRLTLVDTTPALCNRKWGTKQTHVSLCMCQMLHVLLLYLFTLSHYLLSLFAHYRMLRTYFFCSSV